MSKYSPKEPQHEYLHENCKCHPRSHFPAIRSKNDDEYRSWEFYGENVNSSQYCLVYLSRMRANGAMERVAKAWR